MTSAWLCRNTSYMFCSHRSSIRPHGATAQDVPPSCREDCHGRWRKCIPLALLEGLWVLVCGRDGCRFMASWNHGPLIARYSRKSPLSRCFQVASNMTRRSSVVAFPMDARSRNIIGHCLAHRHTKSSASAEAELRANFIWPSSQKFTIRRAEFV